MKYDCMNQTQVENNIKCKTFYADKEEMRREMEAEVKKNQEEMEEMEKSWQDKLAEQEKQFKVSIRSSMLIERICYKDVEAERGQGQ